MAPETEQQEQATPEEESNGGNGGHKTAVRAAAIAAATGATAFAAKKALSGRDESEGDEGSKNRGSKGGGDETMVGAMIASGWHAAKDSLVPFAEDAAGAAGEWIAREGPEFLSETIVPRFIRGFEKARRASSDEGE